MRRFFRSCGSDALLCAHRCWCAVTQTLCICMSVFSFQARRLCLLAGGFLLLNAVSAAPEAEPLALPDGASVVTLTLRENPHLRAARWAVERAQGRLDQSGLLPNPELSLAARSDYFFGNEGEYNYGVSFAQRFPLASRLSHERAVSQAQLEGVQAEIDGNSQAVALQAVLLWRDAIEAQAQLQLLQRQDAVGVKAVKIVRDAAERGERSMLEADQAELELLALRAKIRQAKLQEAQILAQLRMALGVAEGQSLSLPEPSAFPEDNPLQQWHSVNLDSLPAIRSAEAAQRAARSGISLARAERYGDITVSLDYEQGITEDVPVGKRMERFLGFSISVPLPFWNRYDGTLREYAAASREAEARLAAERMQARQSLAAIAAEVGGCYTAALEVRDGLLTSARLSTARLEQGWERGEISLTDLLRARASLIDIEQEALRLQMSFFRALDRHSAASGQLLPKQ